MRGNPSLTRTRLAAYAAPLAATLLSAFDSWALYSSGVHENCHLSRVVVAGEDIC